VARLAQRRERFGAAYVIDLLRGAETQKIIDRGHQQLSVYGIGQSRTQDEWRWLARALLHQQLVDETGDGYPVLLLNAASREVLKGERKVLFAAAPVRERAPSRKQRRGAESADAAPVTPAGEALFERLRSLRKRLADEQRVPPYVVFADAALRAMSETQPKDLDAFAGISGVGKHKLERYGEVFTAEIRAFLGEQTST
jgi:ATP-dependent DNA helicase RecQ